MSVELVAIDFETATAARDSACALGVAVVSGGDVVETRQWLMRPPGNVYSPWNVRVHGITPDRTEALPSFDDQWDEIEPYLTPRVLVAHNAGFDMSVLRGSLASMGRPCPSTSYVCTLQMSRAYFRTGDSFRLPDVADRCGVGLEHHHDAACDAEAAASIALYIANRVGEDDLLAVADRLGVRSGRLAGTVPPTTGARP